MTVLKADKSVNEKLIEEDGKVYNSAGVLLISKKYGTDCVILFKSSLPIPDGVNKGKFYCDIPGGGIDIKDASLEDAAKRELFEETKKLLYIPTATLKNIKDKGSFLELPGRRPHKRKAGLFACYVARLIHVSSKIYNINKEILKKVKIDPVYYETIELVRIPIFNLKEYFANKKLSDIKKQIEVKDIDGTPQFITLLASKCIYQAINQMNFAKPLIDSPFTLNDCQSYYNDLKYDNKKGITIKYN